MLQFDYKGKAGHVCLTPMTERVGTSYWLIGSTSHKVFWGKHTQGAIRSHYPDIYLASLALPFEAGMGEGRQEEG